VGEGGGHGAVEEGKGEGACVVLLVAADAGHNHLTTLPDSCGSLTSIRQCSFQGTDHHLHLLLLLLLPSPATPPPGGCTRTT
jgi:hypothetical protein